MTSATRKSVHTCGRGRRTSDALATTRHPHGRPAIWTALLLLQGGTAAEISKASGAHLRSVKSYLHALTAAGYLRCEDVAEGARPRWKADGPLPHDPPRVRADGTPVMQGSGRDRLWRSMKMLRTFTALDLSVSASLPDAPVKLGEAHDYAKTLHQAGYLAVVRAAQPGRGGQTAAYRLVRNTGPNPPQIQRSRSLYDPNLRKVVWQEGAPNG